MKIDLRTNAKNIRKSLNIQKISLSLVESIRNFEYYQNSNNVMLFYPMKNEIDLTALLSDKKNFYLPRVEGQNLVVCPYKSGDKLIKSSMNIFEPCCEPVGAKCLDLVLVPALMADKSGNRLGYGKGFYDRFIAKSSKHFKTICPIPKQLFVNSLPFDDFDCKVDWVICA